MGTTSILNTSHFILHLITTEKILRENEGDQTESCIQAHFGFRFY